MQSNKMEVTPEVRSLLPEVLINYLEDLIVLETSNLDVVFVGCTLTASQMSGKPIQQIEFLGRKHFVFGFKPLDCKLLVMIYSNHREVAVAA